MVVSWWITAFLPSGCLKLVMEMSSHLVDYIMTQMKLTETDDRRCHVAQTVLKIH